jgi:hypothetical protein
VLVLGYFTLGIHPIAMGLLLSHVQKDLEQHLVLSSH